MAELNTLCKKVMLHAVDIEETSSELFQAR